MNPSESVLSLKRCILDTFRKITGTYYALRQLNALQNQLDTLQQQLNSLQRDMQYACAQVHGIDPHISGLREACDILTSGEALLLAPRLQGKTASELGSASYRTKASLLKNLFSKNWDFLLKTWTHRTASGNYLDIDGIRMTANFPDPDVAGPIDIFTRTFFIYLFFDDNYARDIVLPVEQVVTHVRQYVDDEIDVRVQPGDVVIDAGAWIGDFSAYCAKKGAIVHAFEPTETTYELLLKTVALNPDRILPVMKGLGAENGSRNFGIFNNNAAANRIIREGVNYDVFDIKEISSVDMIMLDSYVEKHNLGRVDFIKADIEGAEDYLLEGAKNTLRKFSPKLSLATYHDTNNIEALQKAILEANPTYKLVQCRTVLFGVGQPLET